MNEKVSTREVGASFLFTRFRQGEEGVWGIGLSLPYLPQGKGGSRGEDRRFSHLQVRVDEVPIAKQAVLNPLLAFFCIMCYTVYTHRNEKCVSSFLLYVYSD